MHLPLSAVTVGFSEAGCQFFAVQGDTKESLSHTENTLHSVATGIPFSSHMEVACPVPKNERGHLSPEYR